MIFSAYGPNDQGQELWRSDGTENGTVQIKDINPGILDGNNSNPQNFTVRSDEIAGASNSFYFTATDGNNGQELWKSDGTENGTEMVKDINPGPADSIPSKSISF